ncbi:hypothetical protein [Macrococcoides canis]|uniref:hypothetical protein n=1 Tax=Macrococcoides canis TaxID=1855823 RepID=UPI001061B461|nr:hypothetical protein [Macrococcus canis]TDM34386.1 hypothetical protein ETI13_00970 [Macrococcus canis]
MDKLVNRLLENMDIKAYLYLADSDFQLLKEDKTQIDGVNNLLSNQLYDIYDYYLEDDFYYIKIYKDDKLVGWIKTRNPIILLNGKKRFITVNNGHLNNTHEINELLKLNGNVESNKAYLSSYIAFYKDNAYFSLEDEYEIIKFMPFEEIDLGDIKRINFELKKKTVTAYKDFNNIEKRKLLKINGPYSTMYILKDINKVLIRFKNEYMWINLKDTKINLDDISFIEFDKESLILDHLISSIKIDKSMKQNNNDELKIYKEKLSKYMAQNKILRENNKRLNTSLSRRIYRKLRNQLR